jgi:hypothetical protein
MANTRCNYCGQVVQFMEIRGNSTCPICRQSSTSCCEGGSCNIVNAASSISTQSNTEYENTATAMDSKENIVSA